LKSLTQQAHAELEAVRRQTRPPAAANRPAVEPGSVPDGSASCRERRLRGSDGH
jgi:hypothetical protein